MDPTKPTSSAPQPRAAGASTLAPEALAALSDDQLVERFRKDRSPEVCALIGARHGQMIFRTCLRRLPSTHDAEDATQAVFLTFVQRPDRVKSPLGAWLHEVARRTVHNMLRARARQQRREEATVQANPVGRSEAAADLREELDAALARLPAKLRGAVIARYLEGQSVADAARASSCDPGTFTRRCTQALDRLRGILAQRGTVVASTALIAFMSQEATAAAPAALFGTVKAVMAGTAVASAPAALLSKQVIGAMFWAKAKLFAVVVASIATVGTAGVVIPRIVAPSRASTTRNTAGAKEVLLRFDFEDGKLPAVFTAGKVLPGPERPGNRFCLGGERTVLLEKKDGLSIYSDDLYLVFDLWTDAPVSTLDLHFWNQTQRGSFGIEPLRVVRGQWMQGLVVRFADFRFGTNSPKWGDVISNLSVQAGQADGKIYVDNLEFVRTTDPRSLKQ
ncbi:MAG: sigma-70 family RNA polymerase sigma factor [Gemmataceae bacterium]|nr:sigma-70 family RNA polymerase sigma factor [Gemmataceae bacterium]